MGNAAASKPPVDVARAIREYTRDGRCDPSVLLSTQTPTALAVPGLAARAFWDAPSLTCDLEAAAGAIRAELAALRGARDGERVKRSLERGEWRVFPIMAEGVWDADARARCPATVRALRRCNLCESALGHAYFSVLRPGARVRTHCGTTNAKLRVQLTLSTGASDDREGAPVAALTVDGETRAYAPSRALVFDDSFPHSVAVDDAAAEERAVLVFDIWHPELAADDIASLARAFDPRPNPLAYRLGPSDLARALRFLAPAVFALGRVPRPCRACRADLVSPHAQYYGTHLLPASRAQPWPS